MGGGGSQEKASVLINVNDFVPVLLQSLTPPLSVGYVEIHWSWSRFVKDSSMTEG